MQAVVCNSDGVPLENMLTIQVSGNSPARIGASRNCSSPVELGKRLLLHAKEGDTEEVKTLISRGAPFTTDWLGISPLHLAAMHGHGETAEVLLRGGISRDARTKVDRTPLHIAAQEGHTDIVDLLISHGADLEAVDMLRMTALHWAVDRGHTDTVLKLLEHGANPNALSKFDKTPIIIAIDNNRADILDVLQNTALYGLTKTSEEVQYINQLAEADSAAENLVVLSGESNLEEVVHTSRKAENSGLEMRGESIKINFLNSSERVKPKPKVTLVSGASSSTTTQNNIQFLRAHGITMLPADESNLVASAMESGQTVVLTEAGKLALNLTRGGSQNISVKKTFASMKSPHAKVVTISAEQLAALTGKVTKLIPISRKMSVSPSKIKLQSLSEVSNMSRVITTTTGKRVFPSSAAVKSELLDGSENSVEEQVADNRDIEGNEEVKNDGGTNFVHVDIDSSEDIQEEEAEADLVTKLAQAKKEADDFRKQLLQKEQEAEEYMKKLQSLTK